ncbi:MAG: hypothetical protein QOE42_1770 [Chloroflexota bacterium]|jgi:hypothetical protein|nr:hypothetical protein [Chloroflexota bacterium]
MSPLPGAYTFLPFARQGLGLHLKEDDLAPGPNVRASIDVALRLTADKVGGGTDGADIGRAVRLYGPGDIVGIDAAAIVRTEPRHWITNFEPNYLSFVEFYDEDFPWRYTPARPSADQRRLRPWITLVVLAEGEFEERPAGAGRPLGAVVVADTTLFPAASGLWAWAHVHVNEGFGTGSDVAALAGRLEQTVRANRDQAYSRLVSPRILAPNTSYHAFVIPSFESGRLAGLGKDPTGAMSATQSAWAADRTDAATATEFPFYHRFDFRTGSTGDFEYLVRLLQPRTVDPRVGRRDLDVLAPGLNLPPIPHLDGILRLGGALRAPLASLGETELGEYRRYEAWASIPEPPGPPQPFQSALAALVNLGDTYGIKTASAANTAAANDLPASASELATALAADGDPLVLPPLYGRWHALVPRLDAGDAAPERSHWVDELNLDPRHRATAGFGTVVIQKNQEDLMEAAWQQVGRVLDANFRIRLAQTARAVSTVWHRRELVSLSTAAPARLLTMVAPLHRRIVAGETTLHQQVQESTLPAATLSTGMRRILRPRGPLARRFEATEPERLTTIIVRLNSGEIRPAPPKRVPAALSTDQTFAERLGLAGPLAQVGRWLDQHPWLVWLPLLIGLAAALLLWLLALVLAAVAIALGAAGTGLLRSLLRRYRATAPLRPKAPEFVDALPHSPDFVVGVPGASPIPIQGATDSPDAIRFKEALRRAYRLDEAQRRIPVVVRQPLDLDGLTARAIEALHPITTITRRVGSWIEVPARIADRLVDPIAELNEVMVYPEIDEPMYRPLKDISTELFLPNLQLIPNNSITLLETNQRFIEAYMVGLNHEFARELLWREYPTDQRGSSFRQFWDVSTVLAEAGVDRDELRERLRDIPEIHRWATTTPLGNHDNRDAGGAAEEELVLAIRGELLKKYPTAVIYAHRAAWQRRSNGEIDKSKVRRLAGDAGSEADPPPTLVKTPLYEARVDPDITFFGFNLTAEAARGGSISGGEDDPGWFFVIKERPGEPRFGLDDADRPPDDHVQTWNELAWVDVLPAVPRPNLQTGDRTVVASAARPTDELVARQWDEDHTFAWRVDTDAAEIAYILYQLPVLMAVHAAEMLKPPEASDG